MNQHRFPYAVLIVVLFLSACQTVEPPEPAAFLSDPVAYVAGATPHSIVVADVDGDAHLDLVLAVPDDDAVAVLRGLGDRTFTAALRYPTGPAPKHAAVADLNGDGVLDLVTANQDSASGQDVSVLLGRASGGYDPALHFGACQNPHYVAVGDFDGDGAPDLTVACWGQDEIAVLLGNGDGTFAPMTLHDSGNSPHSLVVADFDGDSFLDIAVANLGDSSIGVHLGRGDGTFDPVVGHTVGSSPHGIAVGDLNGDGVPDLVSANQGSDDVSVLLGLGDGTFTRTEYATGSVPKGVAIGDVDGDGVLDLITANSHGNHPSGSDPTTLSVLLGTGAGFAAPLAFDSNLTPFAVAVADLDDDGHLDMVSANWHSGDAVVRYGEGGDPPALTSAAALR